MSSTSGFHVSRDMTTKRAWGNARARRLGVGDDDDVDTVFGKFFFREKHRKGHLNRFGVSRGVRGARGVGGVSRGVFVFRPSQIPMFPPAAQPDIIRAHQKDEVFIRVRFFPN